MIAMAGCGGSEPAPAPTPAPAPAPRQHPPSSVDKHLVFEDELDGGVPYAPANHTELLWGDYVDKQGNPAVGWHSHDPKTGNAQ